jgi:hypothetical protein
MSRVVLTAALGSRKYIQQALGLARSLSLIGDGTPRVVISDSDDLELRRWFASVVPPNSEVSTYLQKLQGLEVCDADEFLFIDSDSLVFRKLDSVWEGCQGAAVAVQGEWIRDGHWYGYLDKSLPHLGLDALPMFNGGMIYYRRCSETLAIFEEAHRIGENYDATGLERFRGVVPDEPCLAVAMARTGLGTLLPDRQDYMNTPVGLVGHLDISVARGTCRFLKHGRHGLRLVEPTILHAGKYVNNRAYWRELDRLEWLAHYAERHGYGYMSFTHKLRRSVERRILKLTGRI